MSGAIRARHVQTQNRPLQPTVRETFFLGSFPKVTRNLLQQCGFGPPASDLALEGLLLGIGPSGERPEVNSAPGNISLRVCRASAPGDKRTRRAIAVCKGAQSPGAHLREAEGDGRPPRSLSSKARTCEGTVGSPLSAKVMAVRQE